MIKTRIREDKIDGIGDWVWLECDNGAWTGPKSDWETQHKFNIEQFVKKRRVVIQAGGNQGMYPRLLSEMFDVVYTFEPDYQNFHCLAQNCPQEKIIKFNAALGEKTCLVSMRRPGTGVNTGIWQISYEGDLFIPQLRLDDLYFKHVDFIWLDVEGFEDLVVAGAKVLIENKRPVIFAEGGNKIRDYLESINYRYVRNSVSDSIFIPLIN